MDSLRGPFDLICANLPYVRTADLASVRRAEPRLALDGGADGLRLVRRLVAELSGRIHPGGAAVLEIDPRQAAAVRHLATRHLPGSRVEVLADLAGRARVVAIQVAEPDGG
jgi:release factor glutamine methyltransferase